MPEEKPLDYKKVQACPEKCFGPWCACANNEHCDTHVMLEIARACHGMTFSEVLNALKKSKEK